MAKSRKKKAAPESVEQPEASPENEPVAVETAAALVVPATEEPPFEPTGTYTPTAAELSKAERGGRQFRSWVNDSERGYSRLTDEDHQRIVLQFAEKPPAEVIEALKGAGFHYQPEYQGLNAAWVRYNNHEGRLQIEAIEKLHRELVSGSQSPAR